MRKCKVTGFQHRKNAKYLVSSKKSLLYRNIVYAYWEDINICDIVGPYLQKLFEHRKYQELVCSKNLIREILLMHIFEWELSVSHRWKIMITYFLWIINVNGVVWVILWIHKYKNCLRSLKLPKNWYPVTVKLLILACYLIWRNWNKHLIK